MKFKENLNSYIKIIIVNAAILTLLRFIETTLILFNFGYQNSLISSELLGLLYDFISSSFFLVNLYPVYYLLGRKSLKLANLFFLILISILTILHFLILQYFVYQLIPLDTFLFQYQLNEILFTVKTSDISFVKIFTFLILLVFSVFLIFKFIKNQKFPKIFNTTVYVFSIVSLHIYILFSVSNINLNNFSINKSLFFYTRTVFYLFNNDNITEKYTNEDAVEFQKIFSDKTFLSKEFPLVHKF
jgi:hypothetical protein